MTDFKERYFLIGSMATAFIAASLVAVFVLMAYPKTGDEFCYLFQAETFLKGRLWNSPHPLQEFFTYTHQLYRDGMWLGKFPPGWPAVLATGIFLGLPAWMVNPVLGAFLIGGAYIFTRRFYSRQTAIIGALLTLLSAYFLFNSASFFSHSACALFVIGFVYYAAGYEKSGRIFDILLSGLFAGMIFLIRPYTAIWCILPWVLFQLAPPRLAKLQGIFWFLLGMAPLVALHLLYNNQITSNPLLTPFSWYSPNDRPGFFSAYALKHAIQGIAGVIGRFIQWTHPATLFLYIAYLVCAAKRRSLRFFDMIPASLLAGYTFFYGQNYYFWQYGPRYQYEAYFLIVAGAADFLVNSHLSNKVKTLGLVYGFLLHGVFVVPLGMTAREMITLRKDAYDLARTLDTDRAIIFLVSDAGSLPLEKLPRNYAAFQKPEIMPKNKLPRNNPDLSGDILFAQDRGDENKRLMAYYSGWKFYAYKRDSGERRGRLEQL